MSEPMEEATTEKRFIAYLEAIAQGRTWESYEYWLETNDGDCDDNSYCSACVEIQRRVEKHNRTGYTRVSGSTGVALEHDSHVECDRCGCMLCCSPTEYAIEMDIAFLEDAENIGPQDAAEILNWLQGMGCYERDKHWPMIEPHALRLLDCTTEPTR